MEDELKKVGGKEVLQNKVGHSHNGVPFFVDVYQKAIDKEIIHPSELGDGSRTGTSAKIQSWYQLDNKTIGVRLAKKYFIAGDVLGFEIHEDEQRIPILVHMLMEDTMVKYDKDAYYTAILKHAVDFQDLQERYFQSRSLTGMYVKLIHNRKGG